MTEHPIDIAVARIARKLDWGECPACDLPLPAPTLTDIASGYGTYCSKCGQEYDNRLEDLAQIVAIELAILRNPMKLLEGLL